MGRTRDMYGVGGGEEGVIYAKFWQKISKWREHMEGYKLEWNW